MPKRKPEPFPTVELFPEQIKPAPPPPFKPRMQVQHDSWEITDRKCDYCDRLGVSPRQGQDGVFRARLARYEIDWGTGGVEAIPGIYCSIDCARTRARKFGRET